MSIELLKSISTQKVHKTCDKQGSILHYLGTNHFMVTQRGIEANVIHLKAIMDSQTPASRKLVQQLTGQLAALRLFKSHFTDHLKPLFSTLKGA